MVRALHAKIDPESVDPETDFKGGSWATVPIGRRPASPRLKEITESADEPMSWN
jgi:hypothetical protein